MKNLLIYVNPQHDFGLEEKITAKIQIDNSLSLGWRVEDIILVTNFPYEYNGVKAQIVGDESYYNSDPAMTKTNVIIDLFKKQMIGTSQNKGKSEVYFFHDFDVFQNEIITDSEVESELGNADFGLTDKGRMPRWNFGTLFFKEGAADIFEKTMEIARIYQTTDEAALMVLSSNNLLWATEKEPEEAIADHFIPANIPGMENTNKRIKKINITYNLRMWNIKSTFSMAEKPVKVIHFHPLAQLLYNPPVNELDFFMYGKNKLNKVLMPERLIKIFHYHGIK